MAPVLQCGIFSALRGRQSHRNAAGFTLIEVLVSSVILLVATVGSIGAFNLITQSVRGTGLRADQSRRIDSQIAEISRLSEVYTACKESDGEVPDDPDPTADPDDQVDAVCGSGASAAGIEFAPPNSYYFFPVDDANIDAFLYDACRAGAGSGHITDNLIDAIDEIEPASGIIEGDVQRLAADRVDDSNPANHLITISWQDGGGRNLRTFSISPLVSAWCP